MVWEKLKAVLLGESFAVSGWFGLGPERGVGGT